MFVSPLQLEGQGGGHNTLWNRTMKHLALRSSRLKWKRVLPSAAMGLTVMTLNLDIKTKQ